MALIRPFVPAREFDRSQAFYTAIGFDRRYHDDDLAIFDHAGAGILLQNRFEQGWADNMMLQLFVDGLDDWWRRTDGLADRFAVRTPIAPQDKPWGLRVGMMFDPAGVLWQVSEESRAAAG